MSNKTLNKRIALVAVTALTAGLFSVVAPSAANAGYGTNVVTSSTTNPALAVADTMYIAVVPSTTGSGASIATSSTAPGSTPDVTAGRSVGLVNVSDLAAGLTAGTTTTAVLLSSGAISVYASQTTDTAGTFVVTGGTLSTSSGVADAINSTLTVAAAGTDTNIRNWGVVAKPNSGVTSMTIAYYSGYTKTATAATDNAALLANPTGATGLSLQGQITVSITSASVAGVLAAANSGVYGAASGSQPGTALTADAPTYVGATNWTSDLFAQVRVRDAFATAVSGATGLLQVSATGGALVNIAAGNVSSDGTQSTAFVSTASPDASMIQVSAPSSAPLITTITVSWNGTVIGTKTMQFTGKVAKVELYGAVIGATSGSSNYAYYKLSDAAGNPTYTTISSVAVSAYPYATLSENVAARSGTVTAVAKERNYNLASNYSTVTTGRATFTCGSTAGAGKMGLTFTNLDGSVVNSNILDVKCAGGAVTYKAAWDKASYTPGDLATLKITGYDSKGNVANDVAAVATTLPVVAIGGLDKTITGPTTADALDGGSISYKYTVGATEGTFTGKVTFTTIDERYASDISPAGADAVTITLKVANSSATVSNADVLKSIVALIASINKQIQALQKLILKR